MDDKASFVTFKELLFLKRYSPNTINIYFSLLNAFQKFVGETPIHRLNNAFIVLHASNFVKKKSYRASSHKQLLSALTLYFKECLDQNLDLSSIYPTRKEHFLPQILAKEEVKSLLTKTANLKHRTILTVIYALGLRRGEVLDLKVSDIDGKRMLVHIKNSKGKKDRVLPLSEKLLVLLREYYRIYRPKEYLFYGAANRPRYSAASMRNIFVRACKKAGIKKQVSLHSLRHAYATHLMDAGTDVRMIQELLGHDSIKTTMRYTHVTTRSISNVPSPLDFLN